MSKNITVSTNSHVLWYVAGAASLMLVAAKVFEIGIGPQLEWWHTILPLTGLAVLTLAVLLIFGLVIGLGLLFVWIADKVSTFNRRRKFAKSRRK